MCYICKYTAYTTGNKWAVVASRTSYLTHCTFHSCTRRQHPSHTGGPPPPTHQAGSWSLTLPPSLFSLFFFPKAQTPSQEMIGGHLISRFTHHTQNTQTTFFCLLQSCHCTGKTLPHHTVLIDPPHTVNPTINILSAHAHGKGLGTSASPGHPNTTHHRRSAASDVIFFALKRPSKERSWRQLGGVQNGMLCLEHAPSFHGRLSAWKPF